MNELNQMFDLSDIERKIILFLYIIISDNYFCLRDIVGGFNARDMKMEYIVEALKVNEDQVFSALEENGRLARFGFVDTEDLSLERFFISYLNGAQMTPVTDRFYKLFEGESLSWDMYGKFSEEEGARLVQLIGSKGADRGLNILFHGAPGTGKTSFVQSLAKKMGKQLYMIRLHSPDRESNTKSFRFAALEVANYRLNPEKVIVCVDECDDMLESGYCSNSFMFSFFGGGHRGNPREKSLLNETLDRLKLTTIWVANTDRNSIDPSCRRRFDYNIVFEKVSPKTRKFIWGNVLKRYGMEEALSDEFLTSVSERYPVNTGGIDVAVRNAAYIYKKSPKQDFQDLVMTYLQAHCNILNIRENRSLNEVARDYSLKGLNIKMGPSLDRIIEACKNFCKKIKKAELAPDSPRMNILLAGAPGTGKTEFVKYLAKKLDKKLTIKMANDLLDCFVGETEKRIANAFEEAFQEKSILFIDEGDAMLGSRSKATHNWEVTMVTTLLNQLEYFQGIFVMVTNFAQHLDTAALRRFTYKLQFDYLDDDGKELFYKRSFAHLKLPPMNELEKAALARIEKLTPGDFRTVRQQFYYLGDSKVSHREILDVLQAESNTKPQTPTQDAFNQTKRSIGFSSRESA
jgi:AAA+ superfamily predicted ATPase